MRTIPMGSKMEAAWRMTNDTAPGKADALAAKAVRYALTGDEASGPDVPPTAWQQSKDEIDLLKARRGSNPWGRGGKPKGEPTDEPLPRTPSSLFHLHSSADQESKYSPKKREDARARILDPIGPAPDEDFPKWAYLQKDPVEVALCAADESRSKAGIYGSLLKKFRDRWGDAEGCKRFREECITFKAELDAGEGVNNRGAALVKRLKALVTPLPTG